MQIRSISRAFVAIAATLAFTGCDTSLAPTEPFDSPIVQVLTASTSAGSAVSLRMQNASATDWGYNACASPRLQYLEGDTWVDAAEPLIVCTAELSSLGAGSSRTLSVAVPMGYADGTYRVRFRFLRSDAVEATPVSNSFVVE